MNIMNHLKRQMYYRSVQLIEIKQIYTQNVKRERVGRGGV